ncbi:MAG: N-acetylmuramoyl-L-alanine amidase [Anaerolineae bacterium]|nr:N-acetylmuramoyl-L-alanine amidase [Anaerolineae bacterium]
MAQKPVFPKYIFGLHEPGGEQLMEEKGKKGWILFTERVFHDPNDQHGADYTKWSDRGFGIIVRVNHDYFPGGTIPEPQHYDAFAQRVRNFVKNSRGAYIWIIGNEMNHVQERPREQKITPQLYAQCYKKCWDQIHSIPGHEHDQVAVGSVAPWNPTTTYPGNEGGDWVRYFVDILREIKALGCPIDAITHHTYTHGSDPNLIFSEGKMNPPFQNYHYHFRSYRDFMEATPPDFRNVPVYITETDEDEEWENANRGWVQNAYKEINDWNTTPGNQQIRALILYRWPHFDKWYIDGKNGVQDDFRAAMNHEYVWREIQLPTKIDGHELKGAFLDFYTQVGRDFCGAPISDQVQEDGLPTQYFERLVLQQDLSGRIIPKASGKEVQTLRRTVLDTQGQADELRTQALNLEDRLYELQTALMQMQAERKNPPPPTRTPQAVEGKKIQEIVRPPWQNVVYQLPVHASKQYAERKLTTIQNIVINHSAVPATVTVGQIAQFHVKNMEWPGIGYHFYIDGQGSIYKTNELTTISFHVGNYDSTSVGICVAGNFTKTIPTSSQIQSTAHLIAWLLQEFELPLNAVKGKKEFIDTQSPGQQWLAGQNWKNLLLAEVQKAQKTQRKTHTIKPVYHYVLFWQRPNVWAERDWYAAKQYISRFRPTLGFSVQDASQAKYVTIIGDTNGVDQKAEQSLLDAGCQVERIASKDSTQIRKILDKMATRGQRFASFEE